MKDFLIAFSASTAAIGGIIFAFLISKALGFEGTQSEILESAEKTILEIKKINSKLLVVFISNAIYGNTEDNLIEEYDKKLNEDYFKWENKELYYWVKYVKEDKAYYLFKDEVIEKLIKKKYEFLENKYKTLKKIIQNSNIIESIKDLEKHKEFVFLKNNEEYTSKLKSDIKKEIEIRNRGFEPEMNARVYTFPLLETVKNINFSPTIWPKIRETQKEIGQLLVEYTYKKEEIKHLLKKIVNLKKERNNICVFLGTAYFMIIFGVIYPLSYIKFTNEVKLDYTLYNNFFRELFSFSGFMLFMLFVIFTIFTLKIYLLIVVSNELTLIFNKLKTENLLEEKSNIIENFEFCESYPIKDND